MDKDTVIDFSHVSKKFSKDLPHLLRYGLTDIGKSIFGFNPKSEILRPGEFWSVNDVSFKLKKGETLGIIGPNGSGKTTILKMLNGILIPDKGKIEINGRVGPLIEVGAGFHPLLTGRENIYVNGAILGMSRKEINSKFKSIIDFADIGDFIDSPVKTYSSGMFVRLGFAIAIHCNPEILLIDEILSVGDLSFQNKCLRCLADFKKDAKGLVFVGHNLEQVKTICSKVLVLYKGKLLFSGNTFKGLLHYQELSRNIRLEGLKHTDNKVEKELSSGEIDYIDSGFINNKNMEVESISMAEPLIIFLDFELKEDIKELCFYMGILDENKRICIWSVSNDNNKVIFTNKKAGKYRITVCYRNHHLMPGNYIPITAVRNGLTGETYEKLWIKKSFQIQGGILERGIINAREEWMLNKL